MRLFRKPAYVAGALLGLGLLFGGNPALADVRATFMGTSPGPNGCTYYNYDCFATGGGILKGGLGAAPTQGNFFTFYDFHGFTGVADVIAPAGFVTLAQNTGFTPANTNPVDLPGIANITFVNNTGVNFDGSVVDSFIGTFSICSTCPRVGANDFFAGSTDKTDGTIDNNVEQISGPGCDVPEPGALALVIPGLLPLGLMLRRRRS